MKLYFSDFNHFENFIILAAKDCFVVKKRFFLFATLITYTIF